MSRDIAEKLETLLKDVPTGRRQALKRLLAGAGVGALALLLPATTVMAEQGQRRRPSPDDPDRPDRPDHPGRPGNPGEGSGKGRGRGGKGGRGKRGRGKRGGKGKGSSPDA